MSKQLHPPYEGLLAVETLQVLLVVAFHVTAKLGLVVELVAANVAEMGDGLQVNFVYMRLQPIFAVIRLSTVGT